MQTVTIPALERSVPRLGVGCASVMGRVGRRDSLDGLAAAYDGGARYFDLARSYGYGQAEGLLGEFLRGRRDGCVVVTKVGILPSVPGFVNRVALPIARRAAAMVPAIKKLSARRGPALAGVAGGNFEPDAVVASIEKSLLELGMDHVDLLLLHHVSPNDLENEALLRCLEDAVRSGKTRALGIATHFDESREIVAAAGRLGVEVQLVQLPNNVEAPSASRFASEVGADESGPPVPFVATHSSLAVSEDARERLVSWLEREPERVAALRDAGLVSDDLRASLPRILLGWALAANPEGVTLCGMLKREHVLTNLETEACAARCADVLLAIGRDWREHEDHGAD